jgi:hypothetical protein
MSKITNKTQWFECPGCGQEIRRTFIKQLYCTQTCGNRYRRSIDRVKVIRKLDRTESDIFEWRCYPNGVI